MLASEGNDVTITAEQINWFSTLLVKRPHQPNRASMKSYLDAALARVEVGYGDINILDWLSALGEGDRSLSQYLRKTRFADMNAVGAPCRNRTSTPLGT